MQDNRMRWQFVFYLLFFFVYGDKFYTDGSASAVCSSCRVKQIRYERFPLFLIFRSYGIMQILHRRFLLPRFVLRAE